MVLFTQDAAAPQVGMRFRPLSQELDFSMTQQRLNDAVALATGEDVQTIDRLGFVPLTDRPNELENDDDRAPLVVDWDELELERSLALCG